jgi:hypothetical protein
MIFVVETKFISSNNETIIELYWKNVSKSILLKIILALMKNRIRNQSISEIENFRDLAEKCGSKFF